MVLILNNVNASDKLTVVNSPIPFVMNSPKLSCGELTCGELTVWRTHLIPSDHADYFLKLS